MKRIARPLRSLGHTQRKQKAESGKQKGQKGNLQSSWLQYTPLSFTNFITKRRHLDRNVVERPPASGRERSNSR
ncbi:hypothetical protein G7074_12265 [Pedobacter sp. HDW13]|uniref:hypothetical protein n=1 Tax=Pedobacter sp. HDW13 TaxID=2714940 RepID=UPI00140E24A2|nr:hypothetical protein [Pedobacter sp. HDW13]QIL39971.1 hypothetical protein G7074_12265 [Pedobacter sp. HDW13]